MKKVSKQEVVVTFAVNLSSFRNRTLYAGERGRVVQTTFHLVSL
jgi:hypothetical protein